VPIQGFTRFRKHQVGKQTAFSSNVAATRVLPYRGPIVVDPAREDPDVDVGSLDPILAPFNGALSVTSPWTGKEAFNDAPVLWAMTLKGGVSPTGGGAAKTWTFQAASLTADDFDYITDQWGDDATTDTIIGGSGVINSLELGFGDDLSAWDVNADVVYARAQIGSGPTGGLTVDSTPNWVYGADTEVYLDTTAAAIGTTKLTDAIHGATVTVNNNLDLKRWANGSNTRFELGGYGRGAREITVELVVAKTTATIAERATLDDTPVPNRYIELRTTSPEIITGSTPFSQSIRVPVRLISASDGEIGGNSTITFTYRGFYDSTLTYAIRAVVVCEQATLLAP
jgi:hypothetical protein